MPYKSGKMKGQLTTTEIRKLIRAHNVLMSIKIPVGSKREDIIKIVESNNYKIDHDAGALVPTSEMKRKPKVDIKKADSVLPKPKSKEERAKAKEERDKKKSAKEKELKQEGFKAGASLQRAVSKRQARKKKKPEKEEEKTLTIKDKPKAKKKKDDEILKENGYPTLKEYRKKINLLRENEPLDELNVRKRKEIFNYMKEIKKRMGSYVVGANFPPLSTDKNLFANSVGNIERHFGFLAEKLRKGEKFDKAEEAPNEEAPNIKIKKALRTRLNKDFKKKYNKSIYQVLGLGTQRQAEEDPKSPAEIKKICRKLKLQNHPDKGGDEEVFKAVQEACDIFMETFK
jgi:hypothetical protein